MTRLIFKTKPSKNGGCEYLAITEDGYYYGNTASTAGNCSYGYHIQVVSRKSLDELKRGLAELGMEDRGRV